MKKISLLFSLLLALVCMQANAAIYIVGSAPFGGWDPANGVEMTDNGDGTYSYTATLSSASIWFVFSDGLDSSWDTFNGQYRYGPTTGSDQTVAVDTETRPRSRATAAARTSSRALQATSTRSRST